MQLTDKNGSLETVPCPLCQSEAPIGVHYQFSPFRVVRCRSCGFYYLSPRLKETVMLQMYKEDNYFESDTVGYASYVEQEQSLRATFRRLMVNLKKRNLTEGALLEVGCGYGYLLEEAKDFFETRVGTDFSPQVVEKARSRANRIYKGGIDQVPAEEKFDCIVAIQVIEHIYQPRSFLDDLCKHLKPGGKMVIATPDMGSFWRRFMGHRWPSFKIPEHVLYFSRRTLDKLMREVGFVNIKFLPYPHAFPLSLIAAKLNIPLPSQWGRILFWFPGTTLAMVGVSSDE